MKFGYTILYVEDLEATLSFYESAFGLKRKMVVPQEYGELDTGATTLSFGQRSAMEKLVPVPFQPADPARDPPPMEIALVSEQVQAAFDKALAAGAVRVAAPAQKPWGQTVAYVRDNNGFLVELCTPMA